MTMITPSYLGETIEYSSLHACRSTLEDPTVVVGLLPHANGLVGALKLVSVWLLVQLSGAIVTQLIAGAVRERGPRE